MSKRHKKGQKTEKAQKQSNELSEEHLETVSGGIIAVLQPQVTQKWVNGGDIAVKLVPAVNVSTVKLY